MIPLKVTIVWDNLNYEVIRTYSEFLRDEGNILIISDGGIHKSYNKQYIRKIEILEEREAPHA